MVANSKAEQQILKDLEKGRYDIVFFQEKILGIPVNKAQRRWYRLFQTRPNGWKLLYRYTVHVAANQVGKTLGLAVIILWMCLYKIGVPTDDMQAWWDAPYQWFHLAPSQNQAYHTLNDIRMITKGAHLAQEKGRKEYGLSYRLPTGMVWEDKIENYYQGLSFYHGAVVQFRTTEEKAKAILGYRAAGISFDECAFENHLEVVINEVIWMRLIASGGPLLLVSTPNGMNDFYEVVMELQPKLTATDDEKLRVNEELGEGLTQSTIEDNIGYGVTNQEVERMYASMGEDIRDQNLRGAFLSASDVFFRPQDQVSKSFRSTLPKMQKPVPGHRYSIFWDPSQSSDPTAVVVLDVTKFPWVGVYYDWQKNPVGFDRLVTQVYGLHTLYNNATDRLGRFPKSVATTGFDATSMGGAIMGEALTGLAPRRPINFGGTKKIKLDALNSTRDALTGGKLVLPASWTRMQRELMNYDLDDKDLEQDSVMALAGAVAIAGTGAGSGDRVKVRMHARTPTRRL